MDNILTTVKDRVLQFIDNQGIIKESFFEKTGISASNFKGAGRKSELGGDKIVKILSTYQDLNPDWLMTGKGDMIRKQNTSYLQQRRQQKQNDDSYTAPLMPVSARAGYVSSYDQMQFMDTLEKYALPPGISHLGASWAYFEIDGDSMETTFKSGDTILCSLVMPMDWDNLRNFYTYVIVTESELWIKRVYVESNEGWVLISDNEAYKPFRIDTTLVKQVWVFRRHIKKDAAINKKFDIQNILKQLE